MPTSKQNPLASLLFGNLNEDGELDNDAFDADTLRALASVPLANDLIKADDLKPAEEGPIKPQADAVDYYDVEDDIEDDSRDQMMEVEVSTELRPQQPMLVSTPPKRIVTESDIRQVFPQFSKNAVLKFSELFSGAHKSRFRQMTRPSARLYRDYTPFLMRYGLTAPDERMVFDSERPLPEIDQDSFKIFLEHLSLTDGLATNTETVSSESALSNRDVLADPMFHPVAITDWESKIIWDESDAEQLIKSKQVELEEDLVPTNRFAIPNYDLETGQWEDLIVWDESEAYKLKNVKVEINLNDPNLSVEIQSRQPQPSTYTPYLQLQRKRTKGRPALKKAQTDTFLPSIRTGNQTALDRFNLSNDRYYETVKKGGRVRQQFGKIFIQHSLPALKLQIPLFKRDMSKSEMRAFHRPPLRIAPGDTMQFARMQNLKKKIRWKGRDIVDVLSSTRDLTLRDSTDCVLFEYAEEYPPLLSNGGMGSFIMNYYRKKDEKDQYIPRLYDGAPGILENVDASPFFGMGDVPPGQTMQTIKNNLYIAPIFKQEFYNDDFLLIRVSYQGQVRHYIRTIPRVYVVGQTFPLTEVHPPQSRKAKGYVRDRMKTAAFRRIRKRGRGSKYAVDKMVNNFQRYHEQSLRKHLRDTFNIKRSKKSNSLLLLLKPGINVPSEQELQRMVLPEMACVFESMRVGQQRLADCGYGTGEFGGDEEGEQDPENMLDDEVQMAPWNITRNFLLASHQKGMIQVYGPGDPTGRGEGFSFFWFSMKEMFLWAGATKSDYDAYYSSQVKTGHRFSLQDQQRYYKQELDKVWQRQMKALSSTEDIVNDNAADNEEDQAEMDAEYEEMAKMILQAQKEGDQSVDEHLLDQASVTSSRILASKSLLIRRKIIDELGNEAWSEEVVVDVRVINAYLRQRKFGAAPEDDDAARRKRLKEEIARIRREYGIKIGELGNAPQIERQNDGSERLGKSERSCRSCGRVGHIMTNRICPDYEKNFPEKVKKKRKKDGPVTVDGTTLKIQAVALKVAEEKTKAQRTLKLPSHLIKDMAKKDGDQTTPHPSSSPQPPPASQL
jgi:transcription initiation factor TFIID subunit 1, fungi type